MRRRRDRGDEWKKPLAMSFIPTAKGLIHNMKLFAAQPPVNHSLTLKPLDYKNNSFLITTKSSRFSAMTKPAFSYKRTGPVQSHSYLSSRMTGKLSMAEYWLAFASLITLFKMGYLNENEIRRKNRSENLPYRWHYTNQLPFHPHMPNSPAEHRMQSAVLQFLLIFFQNQPHQHD